MDRAIILATLNLHAVLPRLEDLIRLDEEAKAIASGMNLSVRFRVAGGPSRVVEIRKGRVSSSGDPNRPAELGLLFTSCDQLNNMFMDKPAVPIPYKRLDKLIQMKKFTRLTEIMTRYLRPSDESLKDPAFKRKFVDMTLQTALAGTAQVAKHDPKMHQVVGHLPHGTIQLSVLPDGPFAWVRVDTDKNIEGGTGTIKNPSANLNINGLDVAVDMLADRLDQFAALGTGDLEATGLLPLIDEFGALLDRVGKFLA